MGKGTKASFTCPHELDHGGDDDVEEEHKVWNEVQHKADVSYEVEVIDCSANPTKPPEPEATEIQPNRCIFIVGAGMDGT